MAERKKPTNMAAVKITLKYDPFEWKYLKLIPLDYKI